MDKKLRLVAARNEQIKRKNRKIKQEDAMSVGSVTTRGTKKRKIEAVCSFILKLFMSKISF